MRAKLMPREPFQFTSRAEFRATVTAAAAAPSTAAPTLAAPSAVQGPGLRGRTGGTVVLSAKELGGGEFVLEDLTEVTVWLCGPMRALFIHRLTNCRVYAGAVGGSMLLEDLQDCVVMVAAHQIRIHAAHRTDFYLRVRSNPIVEHCTVCTTARPSVRRVATVGQRNIYIYISSAHTRTLRRAPDGQSAVPSQSPHRTSVWHRTTCRTRGCAAIWRRQG